MSKLRLLANPQGELVSGGADAVVNRWDLSVDGSRPAVQASPAFDHGHSVLALAPLAPGILDDCPTGGFVTGCQDRAVRVYNAEGTVVRQLDGHEHGVISLSFTAPPEGSGEKPLLVSGSWDGTAKLWNLGGDGVEASCVATLPDHENGVCVLGLPGGGVATGSTGRQAGDNAIVGFTVRVWAKGGDGGWVCSGSHEDHGGGVRSLCLAPGVGFASTSNDGTCRLRDLAGETLAVCEHPGSGLAENFVYHVASLEAACAGGGRAEFLTCSEDASAAVWASGATEVDVLEHPDAVWCGAVLANGDVATGCHDGVVRVFTRDPSRAAEAAIVAAFAEACASARARKRGGPSAEEVAKLPVWAERFYKPGRGEGDVKVFNKDGVAVAAQWAAASSDWVVVGEVTGSRNAGTIDGVSFDHVLPIEVELPGQGVQKMKIGYNTGDNPYETAHYFIAKHGLDPDYLERIADYIRKNTGAASQPTIGAVGSGGGGASSVGSGAAVAAVGLGKRPAPAPVSYVRFDKPMAVDKIAAKVRLPAKQRCLEPSSYDMKL